MRSGSASHVDRRPINDPSSRSQRLPAHGSVYARKSDLRRLKASQICSSAQGRFRFHKRLCQNVAGVRCLWWAHLGLSGLLVVLLSTSLIVDLLKSRPSIECQTYLSWVMRYLDESVALHTFKGIEHILIFKNKTFSTQIVNDGAISLSRTNGVVLRILIL